MLKACLTLAAMALTALPALGQTQADILAARLLPGFVTDQGSRMAGLEMAFAPGWKTYWRAPGDAGIPPVFDWTGSQNVKSVRLHWPRPSVFHLNGMQSVGYHDALVLPLEVEPIDPAQPVALRMRVDLGVCKDICMPATLDLSADLTPGGGDAAIRAALADQPINAGQAGVVAVHCTVEPIRDGLRVTAHLDLPEQGAEETVVLESGLGDVWVSEATTTRDGNRLTAVADMVPPNGVPFALDRSGVVLTVIAPDRAVEIRGCPGG
ncbi:MAG: hypothetical protein CFE34_01630 [Rhodobacteraceae bacterium PARR1]|nr:MAG: hypothetical protein CFE34_01630 [Rhodobacteraceae bacterium PARR1]